MKAKNIQSIICLVIFFLFATQAWTADWIYFDKAAVGDFYYDKSSIKKVNESIISVSTKNMLSEEAKMKYFSALKVIHKAPQNPSMLSYYTKLIQIDCINKKIKDISVIFYDEKGNIIYSSPERESSEWNDILSDTVGEKLKNLVYGEPITLNKTVVDSKVEEPVTPKGAVVAAPSVTDKNLAQVNSKKSDWVEFYKSKMGNVTSYKKVNTEKGQEKFVVNEVYSDKDREELIQKMKDNKMSTERYDKLKETMSLYEIDCKKKRKNILSITDYDMDGKVLFTYSYDKKEWVFIVPDSQFDSFQKEVCK